MSGTSVLRGRDQESFLPIDLTGSVGRTLTTVEAAGKTLRFTGTLGQSITLRLPLSATENRGFTGTFENQTSGGFTVTVAPISGTGVDVANGAAITAFYDGTDLVGQTAGSIGAVIGDAATSIPVEVIEPTIGEALYYDGTKFRNGSQFKAVIGSAASSVPVEITDPVIGDAVSWNGTAFVNVAAGAATMAIGSGVTSGTTGSVLFIGAGPVLAQDNANFFWADSTNRLGIGTNAPNAPLHVLDDSATTLATFKGAGSFASVFMQLGDGAQAAALRIYPGVAASGGNTRVSTGGVILRSHYWTGSAQTADVWMRNEIAATTPVYYLVLGVQGVGNVEPFWIRQDGQLTLNTTPNSAAGITEKVVVGSGGLRVGTSMLVVPSTDSSYPNHILLGGLAPWTASPGVAFNGIRIDPSANNDVFLGTTDTYMSVIVDNTNGVRWGTGGSAKMAWWGAPPTTQATSPTGTDTQKIDGLIAILETYGLLGL